MFCYDLDRMDEPLVDESRDGILQWVEITAGSLRLTPGDARNIYQGAVELADAEGRPLSLKDVIKAYTRTTGRPDELDLVTNTSLYADGLTPETSTASEIAEQLFNIFGHASLIPDDGRVLLGFTKSAYSKFATAITGGGRLYPIDRAGRATEDLWKVGGLQVVDWGWPEGLWAPTVGCIYDLQRAAQSPTLVPPPQQQWKDASFTFGLRDQLNTAQHGAPRCGKPWRRLV
jgi:hypothetical protein